MNAVVPFLVAVMALTGCSFGGNPARDSGPLVGDILKQRDSLPVLNEPVVAQVPDPAEVMARYTEVVARVADRQQQFDIARRIAELRLEQANEAAVTGEPEPYDEAIVALESLLEDPLSHANASVLQYQLARAQDLSGNAEGMLENLGRTIDGSDDPGVVLEARFRRGELHFSHERYDHAQADYRFVAESPGTYQLHAGYMLAWSLFKQGKLELALGVQAQTLQRVLGTGQIPEPQAQELLSDTIRLNTLTLDYLDGPESLASLMQANGKPAWQVLLYRALGDWYREKARYQDSARTWETFLAENPLDPAAPEIALAVIDTYRSAGFVADLAARKQSFVDEYDKTGAFYGIHGEQAFAGYHDTLQAWLLDIINAAHAGAQQSGLAGDFLVAADWYERWLLNFEGEEASAEMRFRLAEALIEGGELARAVAAFEALVQGYPEHPKAREGAYGIVITLATLSETVGTAVLDARVEAGLAFAKQYPDDDRAPATQAEVARLLFAADRFEEAAGIADSTISTWQLSDLWRTTALISGHSHFELGAMNLAEERYRALLQQAPEDAAIRQRLLATVYKQGEAAELAGDIQLAISHYRQLPAIDPGSTLTIGASYDIASLLEQAGDPAGAVTQLKWFRDVHHSDELVREIPMRLVALYEHLAQWQSAAQELLAINSAAAYEPEVRRQALYHAGELLLKAGDEGKAIEVFRDYAHTFEEPFELRMEAMHHLDEMYQRTGEMDKRHFWLKKKVATFASASPSDQTQRARGLAAEAAFVLAEADYYAFEKIRLTLPLKQSLKKKSQAMTRAVKAFEGVAAYGVGELVTAATFRIGEIYQSLAATLIDSDRPTGLTPLELAQYELLLEEQAFPFEEQAIDIYHTNLRRGWREAWDPWVDQSLAALGELVPARYARQEAGGNHVAVLY